MKLYGNPLSPFSRKCLVVAHAHGIDLDVLNVLPLQG